MHNRSAARKKLPLKLSRPTAMPTEKPGIQNTSGVVSVRKLPRMFGELGTKASFAAATRRASSNGMVGTRTGAALSSYGPLALKGGVALWIVAMLASVFFIIKA